MKSKDTLKKVADDFGLTVEGVRYALSQYQKVICELTNNKMSKLTYDAKTICGVVYEEFEEYTD